MQGFYPRFKDTHTNWFAQGYPITDLSQLCLTQTGVIAQVATDEKSNEIN